MSNRLYYSVVAIRGNEASELVADVEKNPSRVYQLLVDRYLLSKEFISSGKDKPLHAAPYGMRDKRIRRSLKNGAELVLSWNLNPKFIGLCLEETKDDARGSEKEGKGARRGHGVGAR